MNSKTALIAKITFIVTGIASFLWFLIRVIPKPSRALYPCQRASMPIASSFIIWLVGTIVSFKIIKTNRRIKSISWIKTTIVLTSGILLFLAINIFAPALRISAENVNEINYMPALKTEKSFTIDTFKAQVAVLRSGKDNVADITLDDIQTMVDQAIDLAGGLENLIHDGDTIVIKPNLVCDINYADNEKLTPGPNGIVTDYRVIQAVANVINEINPTGIIYLMEGSAEGNTLDNMVTVGWDLITGIDGFFAIEGSSGEWYEYDSPNLISVNLPDSIALYPDNLKPNNSRSIYLNKIYFNADAVISIPVLKNHSYTGITGSVKNVGIGATPGKIYGNGPSEEYPTQRFGIDHDNRTHLHQWIHDFYACRPVDFVIMDGLQGSDNGPVASGYSSLSQAQRNMRLILAGSDPIAVDAIESLIMAHDPQKIPHLVYLHNDGYGCANPALIEVLGEAVEDIRVDFKISDSGLLSKFTDFVSHDYTLNTISFNNNEVIMSIYDTSNLGRIEITIDGQRYEQMFIGGFNHIVIPLNSITLSDSTMDVRFVDKYLNTLQKSYIGNFVGIQESTKDFFQFAVYPNPARDWLNLSIPESFTGDCLLRIYSSEGKIVFSKAIHNPYASSLNVSNLMPGNYQIVLNRRELTAYSSFTKIE
jgi:uncharacterized protein (DUF362 family)